jgi:thioester reductase-like protein
MKMLLITGVTGFLGGAVLEKILNSDQPVNYSCSRASDPQSGLERVRTCASSTFLRTNWPR